MKNRILSSLAALSFMLLGTAAGAEELRVGTECTSFPFNFRDSSGTLSGYDVDVAKDLGKRLNSEISFVCQKWDGIIPAILANKIDLIVASMGITEERKQKLDFSIPYRLSIGRFVALQDRKLELFDATGKPKADAFKSARIGLQRATTYDAWIQALVPSATVVRYDNVEPMYLDLKAGRVDAIMTNPMKAYMDLMKPPEAGAAAGPAYVFVGPEIADEKYFGTGAGVALRKGNEPLLKRIDEALAAMKKDGSLDAYSKKYFPFAIYPQG